MDAAERLTPARRPLRFRLPSRLRPACGSGLRSGFPWPPERPRLFLLVLCPALQTNSLSSYLF